MQCQCHNNSTRPSCTAPPHNPALLPCGTALQPLPRSCRRRLRFHSTCPIHIALPGSFAQPLLYTTLQPPHCTRVPHTAARSYTALLHFPELPPLRTICGPLFHFFQHRTPDNRIRPVRTAPPHYPARQLFYTMQWHFPHSLLHQYRSGNTVPLPVVPLGVRNHWPQPCSFETPSRHCQPAENHWHPADSPARFPPAFPAALPPPDKSSPRSP